MSKLMATNYQIQTSLTSKLRENQSKGNIYRGDFKICNNEDGLDERIINKNNMLEAISHTQPFKPILTPRQNVLTPSNKKETYNRHILNLSIDPKRKSSSKYQDKTIDSNNFQTFYHSTNISWRLSNAKRWHRNQRKVATSERQSIVGTPFNSLQLAENEDGTTILPLMDKEHYRYLLKAISGIKKGRQLSQIRYKDILDPKKPPTQRPFDPYNMNHNVNFANPQAKNQQESACSPNIVNIVPQLKSRKAKRIFSQLKDNSFQKIFKNKRRLQNKYFDEKAQDNSGFQVSILGDQQLMIHQINWHRKKKSQH